MNMVFLLYSVLCSHSEMVVGCWEESLSMETICNHPMFVYCNFQAKSLSDLKEVKEFDFIDC